MFSKRSHHLQFTQTASYTVGLFYSALTDYGGNMQSSIRQSLQTEADHGLHWLTNMWDDNKKILYSQGSVMHKLDIL